MTRPAGTGVGTLIRLMGLGLAACGLAVLLGYYPTLRLAGGVGIEAMFAGNGVALIAGWVGALPVCFGTALGTGPSGAVNRVLAASAVRMVVTLALTLSIALSGWFPRAPLLVWIAAAYVWTLLVDTCYLVWVLKVTRASE